MVGNPARAWGVEKDLVQTSTVVKRDWGASCLLSVWYNCLWELHQQPSCLQTYSRTLNKMPTVELIRKFTLTSALGNAFRIKTDNSHRLLLFSTYFLFSIISSICCIFCLVVSLYHFWVYQFTCMAFGYDAFYCQHICCQLFSPPAACTCLRRFNYEL